MCNLYSVVTNREAIRRISGAMGDSIGNLPELPGIYPDYLAPIVRLYPAGEREIVLARWGLPSLKDQPTEKPNRGTTNVRHPRFDDWKGYLGTDHRCLVPLTRFAEPCKLEDGSSGNARFALSKDEPLTFFAGLYTKWEGTRRKDVAMHPAPIDGSAQDFPTLLASSRALRGNLAGVRAESRTPVGFSDLIA
jgi:putative SOS response-associated peptidase YedK